MHEEATLEGENVNIYGVDLTTIDFQKFRKLLQDFVANNMSYMCDLECWMIGGIDKCLVSFVHAVQ